MKELQKHDELELPISEETRARLSVANKPPTDGRRKISAALAARARRKKR